MVVNRGQKGFTLLEVMAASVIGAFIAMVAVGTLRTVTGARERIDINTNCTDELSFAAEMIHNDLSNLYRDTDTSNVKLVGVLTESQSGLIMDLTMRTVGRGSARPGQPEGDVYEAQYFLHKEENDDTEKSALMRRLCPLVGAEDDLQSQGGILTVVAENIVGFEVQFFDGQEWQMEWGPEKNSLPHLVEVSLAGVGGREDKPLMLARDFLVSFPRNGEPSEGGSGEEDEDADGNEDESERE
ncbi:MAG: PulJ/GspJ family protein [Planctomycetota bacterium]|jgi:type II secretion system protein J